MQGRLLDINPGEEGKSLYSTINKGRNRPGCARKKTKEPLNGHRISGVVILDVWKSKSNTMIDSRLECDHTLNPVLFIGAYFDENGEAKDVSVHESINIAQLIDSQEVKSQIQTLLRRESDSPLVNSRILQCKNLTIDFETHEVHCKGLQISFTRREFEIVELLARHSGIIFSKDKIYDRIWGWDASGDSACITEHIKKIRSKLSKVDGKTEYISTVWGVGYRWKR